MGKKKKGQTTISWNPLQATTIGIIKENKYGWIGTIILFALFLGIVFYLPDLLDIYNKYFGPDNTVPPIVAPNNTTGDDNTTIEAPERNVEKYTLDEKKSFELGKFSVKNVRVFGGEFSYKITNKTSAELDMSSLNYFFEFYDKYGKVLQTIFVTGRIPKDETITYTHAIKNASDIDKYSLSIIEEEYYTYYDLPIDENKEGMFTCAADNRRITYTFQDEKLKNIADNISYSSEKEDYAEKMDEYQALVDKYRDRKGVSPSLDISDEGLTYILLIDYNLLEGLLDNDEYFPVNTSPRVVKFKLEALGYSCSWGKDELKYKWFQWTTWFTLTHG